MDSAGELGAKLLIVSSAVITSGETFAAGFNCLELGEGENLQAY
jgi:hypothetical protein